MTEADLTYVETELNLTLPADYRALCLNPPFAELKDTWVYWLYDDPDDIVNETRFPLEDGEYSKANWKQTYVVIGRSASGDLHLIDTALTASPVYLLSHEDHSIVEEWPSLSAFIEYWNREAEQTERAREERARRRKREAEQMRRGAVILLLLLVIGFALIALMIRSPHSTRRTRLTLGLCFLPALPEQALLCQRPFSNCVTYIEKGD